MQDDFVFIRSGLALVALVASFAVNASAGDIELRVGLIDAVLTTPADAALLNAIAAFVSGSGDR